MTEEWKTEPNLFFGTYKKRKYFVARHSSSGHLCGYVDISSIPDFPISYLECHGGITFDGTYDPEYITKIVDDKEITDKFLKFYKNIDYICGFDCAHCDDISPNYSSAFMHEFATYKNLDFCINECKGIINQISKFNCKYYIYVDDLTDFDNWKHSNKYKVFYNYVGTNNKEDFMMLKLAWK